jgi:hypothetical protein
MPGDFSTILSDALGMFQELNRTEAPNETATQQDDQKPAALHETETISRPVIDT